ncbi:hypothetical protein CRG98_032645 [Punica granatum]|uniref:Transcription factor RAX3-like n=1 Tax=Punica granatum TaxID=22663 RepID=A0A2I0IU70_PUNGR|nr:hypothetical protein CRG98_032645 [Punica granatum]
MGRAPCCDKANVKKGPWSPEEDAKLKSYIEQHGTGGLKRCGKSCRLRWLNYLRPNIKHGGFSEEEDDLICSLYVSIGSRWSIIAAQLPGRTDNDIKNYWNTRLKKKLLGKQRKEYGRRGNNSSLKRREKKKGSIAGEENSMEYPSSFSSNQGTPYWPELPAATPTTMMPYSNLEGASFNDHTSMRKLLIKLGGRFSDHNDQVAMIQAGASSLHQYSNGQSSSSPSQNPNYDHDQSMAMLSSATIIQPQFGVVEGGITTPSALVEETQRFGDPQRLDGLEFLLGDGIETACAEGPSVNWNDMSSVIYPNSVNVASGYGLGIQQSPLQECSFSNELRYSVVQ